MLDRGAAAAAARIVRLGRSVRSGGRCLVNESARAGLKKAGTADNY